MSDFRVHSSSETPTQSGVVVLQKVVDDSRPQIVGISFETSDSGSYYWTWTFDTHVDDVVNVDGLTINGVGPSGVEEWFDNSISIYYNSETAAPDVDGKALFNVVSGPDQLELSLGDDGSIEILSQSDLKPPYSGVTP